MLKEIPIVMASDENYFIPMAVTMASLILNAEENTKYQFHLLLTEDFSDDKKQRLNNIVKSYGMPPIKYYNMMDKYENVISQIEHISKPTFYRLEMPSLLHAVDKCIYLDVDIVVNEDLTELYDVEMDDYYIAGVKAAGYYYPEKKREKMRDILDISDFNQYVNAGMLVVNLELMRKTNLQQKFRELLKKNFPNNDQDILNCACYGKIKILELKYNAMTKYSLCDKEAYKTNPCLAVCYSRKEWDNACNNPIIIHYADKRKPWEDMSVDFSEIWWDYAEKIGIGTEAFKYFRGNMLKKQKSQRTAFEMQIRELTEIRDAYRRENLDLKKQIKEVWNETDSRIKKLRDKREELETALKQRWKEISELKSTLEQVWEEKKEINKKLRKTKEEVEELRNKNSYLNKKIKLMEKNIGIKIARKFSLSNYDNVDINE